MEMPPDTLEAVGVNELFVVVTVDTSFTTEQAVVGLIDEIQILIEVWITTIVGYLSPSQICDVCALLRVKKLDMVMSPDSLEDFLTKETRVSSPWCVSTSSLSFSICPSRPGDKTRVRGLPKRSWTRRRSTTKGTGTISFTKYPVSSMSPQFCPRLLMTCCVLTRGSTKEHLYLQEVMYVCLL
jgi:hypothetical protein